MRTQNHFLRLTKTALCSMIVLTLLLFSSSSNAQSLQKQLQKHMPSIIDYCNKHQIKTVGVLKFRTKKPGEKTSDSAGPINSLIADRLECGLILANPFDKAKQINVIKNASQQLVSIEGANHLTAAGRQVCFKQDFDIAWGDKRMKPDAFLTGVVQLHADGENVTVGILCFKKDGSKMETACDVFQAEIDATTASEMGESFVMRSGIDAQLIKGLTQNLLDEMKRKPNSQQTQNSNQLTQQQVNNVKSRAAVKKSVQVKTQRVPFPLSDPYAPVRLVVLYDGKQMPVQISQGRAFLPEPRTGQKVEFLLVRKDGVTKRTAVVLKVNGENTLYRQTARDIDCTKWVLSERTKQVRIQGYQLQNNQMEEFKVLSRDESAKRAMDYGRQVGQIHMAVFQEADPADAKAPSQETLDMIDEADEDMLAMMRGSQPSKKPSNLGALKQQIRNPNANELATRGLIVQGEKKTSLVKKVKMKFDPTPIMAVTITYYTPN